VVENKRRREFLCIGAYSELLTCVEIGVKIVQMLVVSRD
jgi:hypothetical protein